MLGFFRQLTGAGTMPFGHHSIWGFSGDAGDRHGSLAGTDDLQDSPLDEYFAGMVTARSARRARRPLRLYRKHKARADSRSRIAEARGPEAIVDRAPRRAAQDETEAAYASRHPVLDFFVSSPLIYLLSYGVVVFALEAAGMLTSLVAFDHTLGEFRVPMALAAGAILVLAGHGIGHLLHEARSEQSRTKLALAAAVAVVLVTGLWTIAALGSGRDSNMEAADLIATSGTLTERADELNDEADELVGSRGQPQRALRGVPARARQQARRLRRRAGRLERRAASLGTNARETRTLGFFVAVQSLGLVVGALGGYLWAGGGLIRDHRTRRRFERLAHRSRAKAGRHRDSVRLVVEEECGLAHACHGAYTTRFYASRESVAKLVPWLGVDADEVLGRLLRDRHLGRHDIASHGDPSRNGGDPAVATDPGVSEA
ncbi:MAG: hypothetical protein GXY03_13810 [Solirubrobacterales bacterium]|nr:hypothetical protein [Solirubrobacterales bacterium]